MPITSQYSQKVHVEFVSFCLHMLWASIPSPLDRCDLRTYLLSFLYIKSPCSQDHSQDMEGKYGFWTRLT